MRDRAIVHRRPVTKGAQVAGPEPLTDRWGRRIARIPTYASFGPRARAWIDAQAKRFNIRRSVVIRAAVEEFADMHGEV
jgi:hypothetical protein